LRELVEELKKLLSPFDSKINDVAIHFGPERIGDIKHSLASIEKAKKLLGYDPSHNVKKGLSAAIKWYWEYFTN